jgi:hypothetical protein
MKQGKKIRTVALLAMTSALIGIGSAYAATKPITATIRFLTDISIAELQAPNFGSVAAATAASYKLDTANGVTSPDTGIIEGGVPKSGDYTITASTAQGIDIYVDTYGVDGDSTPSAAVCKYDGGSEVTCDGSGNEIAATPSGASTDLKVGLTITAAGSSTDNEVDHPTLDLHVLYQ